MDMSAKNILFGLLHLKLSIRITRVIILTGSLLINWSSDDITHDFDDRKELCLERGNQYLETGSVFKAKGSLWILNVILSFLKNLNG